MTRVRFVSSLFLKWDFSAFKLEIFSMEFDIVVTDVVIDVKHSHKSVNTRVDKHLLLNDVICGKTVTSFNKKS